MIEVMSRPFYDDFLELCRESDETIKLCTPFIKSEILSCVLKSAPEEVNVSLVTNINLQSFHKKASDIEAVRRVLLHGGNVYNCTTLHAKFYIFDDQFCIITSANLTPSGMKRNLECGIFSDDSSIVQSVVDIYTSIVHDTSRVGEMTLKSVDKIAQILDTIPSSPGVDYPSLDLSRTYIHKLNTVTRHLTGWKKWVFLELNNLCDDVFTSHTVRCLGEKSQAFFPDNNNREAKIRQTLQYLRDMGLVEFTSPGVYKRLWVPEKL